MLTPIMSFASQLLFSSSTKSLLRNSFFSNTCFRFHLYPAAKDLNRCPVFMRPFPCYLNYSHIINRVLFKKTEFCILKLRIFFLICLYLFLTECVYDELRNIFDIETPLIRRFPNVDTESPCFYCGNIRRKVFLQLANGCIPGKIYRFLLPT